MVSGGGVEMHSPPHPLYLKVTPAREGRLTWFQGFTPSVSTLGPAAGSQRDWPLAVMRSSSGLGAPSWPDSLCNSTPHPPPRVMQLGAGGACGKAGGGVGCGGGGVSRSSWHIWRAGERSRLFPPVLFSQLRPPRP